MYETPSQLYFVRNALYDLKNQYPAEAAIYQYVSNETDQKTGKRSVERKVTVIYKTILMPNSLLRKFIFDRAYMFVNKQFTYGGTFDLSSRILIIDKDDVPDGFEITNDDYIVINNKRYELKNIEEMEHDFGYLLTIQETKGALPYAEVPIKVENTLQLDQVATNES